MKASINFVLLVLYLGSARLLDCNDMDPTIATSLSLSATQYGYSYSYTGNIFDGEV